MRSVATRAPSAYSRTVAGWATLELMSAVASISSPSRAVEGVVNRSTRTSSRFTSPMTRVSTWMPRAAASAASRWPRPVVSLPSEIRTIRFWAASGNSAEASRKRRPDIRRGLHRRAAQPIDLAQLLGQPLDERVLAERDDARLVLLGHHLQRLAKEREGILATGRPDAVGQVDDEHGGEAIDREHELESGEREDERGHEDRPHGERGAPPAGADAPARGEVRDERQEECRDQQDEPDRGLEAEAHQRARPASSVPLAAAAARAAASTATAPGVGARAGWRRAPQAAPQPRDRVAVVHEPLDDQHDEHDQDDHDPQLVAGHRARSSTVPAPGAPEAPARPSPRGSGAADAAGRRGGPGLPPERDDRRRRARARCRSRSGRTGPRRIARERSDRPAARWARRLGSRPARASGRRRIRSVAPSRTGVGAGPDGPGRRVRVDRRPPSTRPAGPSG